MIPHTLYESYKIESIFYYNFFYEISIWNESTTLNHDMVCSFHPLLIQLITIFLRTSILVDAGIKIHALPTIEAWIFNTLPKSTIELNQQDYYEFLL